MLGVTVCKNIVNLTLHFTSIKHSRRWSRSSVAILTPPKQGHMKYIEHPTHRCRQAGNSYATAPFLARISDGPRDLFSTQTSLVGFLLPTWNELRKLFDSNAYSPILNCSPRLAYSILTHAPLCIQRRLTCTAHSSTHPPTQEWAGQNVVKVTTSTFTGFWDGLHASRRTGLE